MKIDVKETMEEYLSKNDWRVKANANQGYSVGGLILQTAGKVTANYWLSYVYPKELGDLHRNGDYHIHDLDMLGGYCLTGNTKIKLLSGEKKTIKSLAEAGKSVWVWSYDVDKKRPVPSLARNIRMTRKLAHVVDVFLDNGEVFSCTPDHKILLRNGEYKEAQNLTTGDSLRTVVTRYNPMLKRDTVRVKKSKPMVHRYVYEVLNGPVPNGYVVNHKDGNRFNNSIENLELMKDEDHRRLEISKTRETDVWKKANNSRMVDYNKSLSKKAAASSLAKQRNRGSNGRFLVEDNHKVVNVVEREHPEDVFCMEVPTYHNFALENGVVVHNCAGWSLRKLLEEGFNGVSGRVESNPPKHFSAAIGQIVNFFGSLQNEWAGAQAFSSFDTYLAPFVKADSCSFEEVCQNLQQLVFDLNVPSRWASQSPFTNLTFDWTCPEDLKNEHPLIGGVPASFTYGDCHDEMDMLNKAFMTVMLNGDGKGRVFAFPIPTYNITKDFPWDSENTNLLFEMTAKYGLPYFQNFINSDLDPHMIRSMCCRLQLDLNELVKRGNGLFGSAEQTGSIGVVTLNCARLGYLEDNEEGFFMRLQDLLVAAKDTLEIKRRKVQEWMDNGLYPYSKRYLGTLRNHFSTIGVNGMNEMCLNFLGYDLSTDKGIAFTEKVLAFIRERLVAFQEETGHMYNLEATPAEGTTYRLAKIDQEKFPGIIQAGTEWAPYYTNSSQLPVDFSDDVFEVLELQDRLQTMYTGGTVLHVYSGDTSANPETCKKLVKNILTNYRLPYITITPTFSVCPIHGYIPGEHHLCPKCLEMN